MYVVAAVPVLEGDSPLPLTLCWGVRLWEAHLDW